MMISRDALLVALLLSGCGGGAGNTGGVYLVTPASAGISATQVAGAGFEYPTDSVPTSDGAVFYFLASTPDGTPGVFKVPAAAGASVSTVASGAPLLAPLGISISSDDKTLYVADPAAGLFALPAAGGAPTLVAGTACMKPRSVDVASQNGADAIYFTTGGGACGGGAGLARVAASGGAASFVASGAPFAVPMGVAVAKSGDAYVSNPAADAPGPGNILVVSGGKASALVSGFGLGDPAGLALNVANDTLFVSGIDSTGHDEVIAVTLASKSIATYNSGIGQNTGASGLHRASGKDVFSWADTPALPMPHGPIIFK